MERDLWVMHCGAIMRVQARMKTRCSPLLAALIAAAILTSCTADQRDAAPISLTSTTLPSDLRTTAAATLTSLPAVSTVTSTPVPSPTSPESAALLEETFTDNRNNWYTNSALVSVESGTYLHGLECPDSSSSAYCGNFVQIPLAFPSSFRMEIEVTITRASEGASVMVGFQVRRSDHGYYYLNYGITDRYYQMSRVTQTGAFPVIAETQTDSMRPSLGDTNIPGIQINAAEFTPLLNGQEMSPVHDGNIPSAGDTYLVVLVERGHTAEVQFDNLIVTAVD